MTPELIDDSEASEERRRGPVDMTLHIPPAVLRTFERDHRQAVAAGADVSLETWIIDHNRMRDVTIRADAVETGEEL